MAEGPRRLCLLRHAKSSWEDASLPDFDRPLAPRGRQAAPLVAAWVADAGLRPDVVLCSPALRTRQTWDIVAPFLDGPPEAHYPRSIYEAPWVRLLKVLRDLPETAGTAMLIGHNPGMEDLACRLARGDSDADALARLRRKFPTAALAVFECSEGAWADLGTGAARLTAFVRPKDLARVADLADPDQVQKRDRPA